MSSGNFDAPGVYACVHAGLFLLREAAGYSVQFHTLEHGRFDSDSRISMPLKNKETRKEYHAQYMKGWYSLNKDQHKKFVNVSRRKKRAELKSKLQAYKLERGCGYCGYNKFPEALDFDHVTGIKSFNLSQAVHRCYSWDRILSEIDKCKIACANCHRERTAGHIQ